MKNELTDFLLKLQPTYQSKLINDVKEFEKDLNVVTNNYEQDGPMKPNITIEEAIKRVSMFSVNFLILCLTI